MAFWLFIHLFIQIKHQYIHLFIFKYFGKQKYWKLSIFSIKQTNKQVNKNNNLSENSLIKSYYGLNI